MDSRLSITATVQRTMTQNQARPFMKMNPSPKKMYGPSCYPSSGTIELYRCTYRCPVQSSGFPSGGGVGRTSGLSTGRFHQSSWNWTGGYSPSSRPAVANDNHTGFVLTRRQACSNDRASEPPRRGSRSYVCPATCRGWHGSPASLGRARSLNAPPVTAGRYPSVFHF